MGQSLPRLQHINGKTHDCINNGKHCIFGDDAGSSDFVQGQAEQPLQSPNLMAPTIQNDDTVMIDTGRKSLKEGMIYAIRVDSTVMIKRLSLRLGGKIQIISDNRQEYESYEAELKDLHIIGQIIFFCRTFATE